MLLLASSFFYFKLKVVDEALCASFVADSLPGSSTGLLSRETLFLVAITNWLVERASKLGRRRCEGKKKQKRNTCRNLWHVSMRHASEA